METLKKITVTFFYTGMIPFMPGTMGTLGAAILYLLLWKTGIANIFLLSLILMAACIINIIFSDWAENFFQTKDPSQVVIDEVAGYFLTVLFFKPSMAVFIAAFILFRFFDITKIYPINQCEKLSGGLGILLDDLVSAIFALIILFVASFFINYYNININITPIWF